MSFYVVLKGRKPGVYTTWPECHMQVNGFKALVISSAKIMRRQWVTSTQITRMNDMEIRGKMCAMATHRPLLSLWIF
ncbi:hypothetical protein M6B38_326850 [Iris pallida]|uniref:Ribonuclease H1 N-terminal domain-containing protein n=1 Tax=Iris pallida TaxID=29817 RepID=A0AAX6H5V2_IRIPA|nr:hypothetical protein M6B38_326850 [Iris pallida]